MLVSGSEAGVWIQLPRNVTIHEGRRVKAFGHWAVAEDLKRLLGGRITTRRYISRATLPDGHEEVPTILPRIRAARNFQSPARDNPRVIGTMLDGWNTTVGIESRDDGAILSALHAYRANRRPIPRSLDLEIGWHTPIAGLSQELERRNLTISKVGTETDGSSIGTIHFRLQTNNYPEILTYVAKRLDNLPQLPGITLDGVSNVLGANGFFNLKHAWGVAMQRPNGIGAAGVMLDRLYDPSQS